MLKQVCERGRCAEVVSPAGRSLILAGSELELVANLKKRAIASESNVCVDEETPEAV